MALGEQCIWEIVGERLCDIFNIPNPDAMEKARLKYIAELEAKLREEVHDAEDYFATIDKSSRSFDEDEFETNRHTRRRIIAANHQTLDLLKQGKQACIAAMRDKAFIFEGHWYVAIHRLRQTISYSLNDGLTVL